MEMRIMTKSVEVRHNIRKNFLMEISLRNDKLTFLIYSHKKHLPATTVFVSNYLAVYARKRSALHQGTHLRSYLLFGYNGMVLLCEVTGCNFVATYG